MTILPDNDKLQYSGRIDFSDKREPVFVYPCSWVKIRFTGDVCRVIVKNQNAYWDNYLGYVIDGVQGKLKLSQSEKQSLEIPVNINASTSKKEHELMIFKRQDSCHIFKFYGIELEEGAEVLELEPKPKRRIEVYGDSVSAGEVAEAVEYAGKPDPEHNGEYSNSWYSYAWMTARKLDAEIHDIAQGGVALLDGTGWFAAPDYMGMEKMYNKIQYNPEFKKSVRWDFSKYTPHVVIIAIGQNDNNPTDYMALEPHGISAYVWKSHYKHFVETIRKIYPKAVIILTTTILRHSPNWDKAIEDVCLDIDDDRLYHFLYSNNGVGTLGHIRVQEAEQMSDELSEFINSLGDDIWQD